MTYSISVGIHLLHPEKVRNLASNTTEGTHVDVIDNVVDLGHVFSGVSNHVLDSSWSSNGELNVLPNSILDCLQEEGESFNLPNLVRIGSLSIVLAISARELPVDICSRNPLI
jgi:hypothetical protein